MEGIFIGGRFVAWVCVGKSVAEAGGGPLLIPHHSAPAQIDFHFCTPGVRPSLPFLMAGRGGPLLEIVLILGPLADAGG